MSAMLVCLAASLVGVDVGWQRLPDGQWELIIQIEPELLEEMDRFGESPDELVAAGLPPQLRGIRRYRIQIGTGALPREEGELPPVKLTSDREGPASEVPSAPAEAASPGNSEPAQEDFSPIGPGYSPPPVPFPEPKPARSGAPEQAPGATPAQGPEF